MNSHLKIGNDLLFIHNHLKDKLNIFKNRTIFITGGTGFFGKWLLEYFNYVNSIDKLNIKIIILSRAPENFLKNFPQFSKFTFIKGDIESFSLPNIQIDYIIHAAAIVDSNLNCTNPELVYDNILNGTLKVLDLAKSNGTKKLLNISSGAVYGKQPTNIEKISENFIPEKTANKNYGSGKKAAEELGIQFSRENNFDFISTRCFAFAGAYLPLDKHYAIGNFINDGLASRDIIIKGDGTPRRSYLYAADLIIWLITVLVDGKGESCYNIGSDIPISIHELAIKISKYFPSSNVKVLGTPSPSKAYERYLPSIDKCKNELSLEVYTPIDSAIKKMIQWHKKIV